jgi:hypothetical protein
LVDAVSLREVAGRCGIALPTAFRWRHRHLQVPKGMQAPTLAGIVEADDTYFLRSAKGSPHASGASAQQARRHGKQTGVVGRARIRSNRPYRHGATVAGPLFDRSEASMAQQLDPVLAHEVLLVSDAPKPTARSRAGSASVRLPSHSRCRMLWHLPLMRVFLYQRDDVSMGCRLFGGYLGRRGDRRRVDTPTRHATEAAQRADGIRKPTQDDQVGAFLTIDGDAARPRTQTVRHPLRQAGLEPAPWLIGAEIILCRPG